MYRMLNTNMGRVRCLIYCQEVWYKAGAGKQGRRRWRYTQGM